VDCHGVHRGLLFACRHANYYSVSRLNPLLRLGELIAVSTHRVEISGECRVVVKEYETVCSSVLGDSSPWFPSPL
jgi:hypothetical protein